MGIELYDALAGLGAGLTSLGQSKETRRKEELAAKLEEEREARAEKRQLAAEQRADRREAARVAKTRNIQRDGQILEQHINSSGDVIREEAADPLAIESINMGRKKEQVSIDSIIANTDAARANAEQNRAETAYLPKKYALDAALTSSSIEENRAQAESARALALDRERGDPKDRIDTSLGGLTERLLDQSKDLMEQYKEDIPATEFRRLAAAAIKEAARKKADVRITFPYVLEAYLRKKNAQ